MSGISWRFVCRRDQKNVCVIVVVGGVNIGVAW